MPSPDQVRERLAERARRNARIRRGVGAATLATFVLAWGVIAHSGSMGTTTDKSTTTAAATASDRSSSTTTAPSDAPVTTAQS
jgi:hypothetical protein